MISRPIHLALRLSLFLCAVALLASGTMSNLATAAPTMQPQHGLTGHYYTRANPDSATDTYFGGYSVDDNKIPTPLKQPDAVRVDPQIAFGKGRGLVLKDDKQEVWWTPEDARMVIWKGYIHLPKAGTYYFPTVSKDSSAVYLNQARVTLNGNFGGVISSEAFSFVDPDQPNPSDPAYSYIVPVTIDKARDLPIEVRYVIDNQGMIGFGIDLYWVTPDSKKDSSGKSIAEIVPTEALYVEAPGPIEVPVVKSANSTISSDFLYVKGQNAATLTIRLADENGRPVAGKRVHVSGLSSWKPDTIIQPTKPTDENGVTTAFVKDASGRAHDSTFYATDLTDIVDVAQVASLTFEAEKITFFPDTYAPYYDDKQFLVEPLPLTVGRQVTITVPLKNRSNLPAELTVTFKTNAWNIGSDSFKWRKISDEKVTLQPGETKEVTANWTPTETFLKACFLIEIGGQYLPTGSVNGDARKIPVGLSMSLAEGVRAQTASGIDERLQRNIGSVGPCNSSAGKRDTGDPGIFGLPPNNIRNEKYGICRVYRSAAKLQPLEVDSKYCNGQAAYQLGSQDDSSTTKKKNPRIHGGNDYQSRKPGQNYGSPLPFTSPIRGTVVLYPGSAYNTIAIKTCDGYIVQFLHSSQIDVKNGQQVTPGTRLGTTGEKGATAGAVHLHVQVKDPQGKTVDPNDPNGPLAMDRPCDPPTPCVPAGPPIPRDPTGESPKAYGKRTAPLYRMKADQVYEHAMANSSRLSGSEMEALLNEYKKWDAAAKEAQKLADDPPDTAYTQIAVARSDSVAGYIEALRISWERYQAAQAEGDGKWMAQQLTASRLYQQKVAEAERGAAEEMQKWTQTLPPDGANAQADADAVRKQFLERLRAGGLTQEELNQLQAAGISEEESKVINYRLLQYVEPGTKVELEEELAGDLISEERLPATSLRALLIEGATLRLELAKEGDRLAVLLITGSAAIPGQPFSQTYLVGNPRDKEETVDLFIRPVSIPPNWKLSVVNVQEQSDATAFATPTPDPSKPRVREVVPGKHYQVRLPAGAEIEVASVLVPVGEVGANTTARWAVEGKIGTELIGGMMHEFNVPYIIPDLQLPPVGSVPVEESAPSGGSNSGQGAAPAITASTAAQPNWLLYTGIGVTGLLIIGAFLFVLLRRRRA